MVRFYICLLWEAFCLRYRHAAGKKRIVKHSRSPFPSAGDVQTKSTSRKKTSTFHKKNISFPFACAFSQKTTFLNMQRRLNEWLSGRMNSSSSIFPSEIEFRPSSPEVQLLTSLRERAKARTNEFGALFLSFLFFKGGEWEAYFTEHYTGKGKEGLLERGWGDCAAVVVILNALRRGEERGEAAWERNIQWLLKLKGLLRFLLPPPPIFPYLSSQDFSMPP